MNPEVSVVGDGSQQAATPTCSVRVVERDGEPHCGAPATLEIFGDPCPVCAYYAATDCTGHPCCEACGTRLRTDAPVGILSKPEYGTFRTVRLRTLVAS